MLVAALCAGEIGAVLCFDASRLARNGRDWHHLLVLCGLVEAHAIDLDGVYAPCRPNDRLLLGMKGSISEFELGVIRARMVDTSRAKARRGELRISVPIGYIWHRDVGFDRCLAGSGSTFFRWCCRRPRQAKYGIGVERYHRSGLSKGRLNCTMARSLEPDDGHGLGTSKEADQSPGIAAFLSRKGAESAEQGETGRIMGNAEHSD